MLYKSVMIGNDIYPCILIRSVYNLTCIQYTYKNEGIVYAGNM